MMTKKLLLCALCAFALTACSDDDDNNGPKPERIETSEGVFVINQGSFRVLPGSVSYIDYKTSSIEEDAYKNVNGFIVGDTPYDAIVCGSKIYFAVQESNVIQVADRHTLKNLKTIKPTAEQGSTPKKLAAKDGKVYVSLYDGHVARIDTLSLAIDKSVKVGPNPEGIAIAGNHLYSADSDGMNYQNGYGKTVSKINLSTFEVEKTIEVGTNPTCMVSNGTDVFVICMGDYSAENPAAVKHIKSNDTVEDFCLATNIAIKGDKLYVINSPYGSDTKEYLVYSISDRSKKTMVEEGVDSPTAIGVDPVSGKIFIGSADTSYLEYWKNNGYINEYNADGKFVKRYPGGVNPQAFTFNVTEAK